MKSFKSYIQENVKQECGIKYGKYLFGEMLGQGEEDTPEEKNLLSLLNKYIGVFNHRKPELENALKQLRKCKTLFKKELIAKGTFAYRGLFEHGLAPKSPSPLFKVPDIAPLYKLKARSSNSDDYEGLEITVTGFDYHKKIDHKHYIGFDVIYVPQNAVESWTTNIKDNNFIGNKMVEGFADIIYQIPLKQNEFIFDAEFLDKITTIVFSSRNPIKEYEVIRVEKKPSRAICYVNIDKVIEYLEENFTDSFEEDSFYGPVRYENNKLIFRPLV